MFTGYHHIGLTVTDMERSLKFYTEGLGGKVTFSFEVPMGKIYMVEMAPGAVIELLPRDSVSTVGEPWAHIALQTDNCRQAFDAAIAAGATVRSEPRDGNLGGGMEMCGAFVLGPDGEVVEFFEVK